MNKIFKAYSKNYNSLETDSIFSLFGRNEVGLTTSLAALLFHETSFLKDFLRKIEINVNLENYKIFIHAEQPADIGTQDLRRDICIYLKNDSDFKLVVIEAKHPSLLISNPDRISNQLNMYFSPDIYSDLGEEPETIGVTLTKDQILTRTEDINYDRFVSLTWKDIFFLTAKKGAKFSLQSLYNNELKRANFMKAYTDEVFSPPAGSTYEKILRLNIYCCPADRVLRNAIYLMPRIPVNNNENLLEHFNLENIEDYQGRGFALNLYEIEDTFIADPDSLDAIQDVQIRLAVQEWLGDENKRLKVFVLGEKMEFERPKFTTLQNNAYQGYYRLAQLWNDEIPPSN